MLTSVHRAKFFLGMVNNSWGLFTLRGKTQQNKQPEPSFVVIVVKHSSVLTRCKFLGAFCLLAHICNSQSTNSTWRLIYLVRKCPRDLRAPHVVGKPLICPNVSLTLEYYVYLLTRHFIL